MKDVDIVFHNAAYVSIRGSFQAMREELEANALGTLNVLEAAANSSVEKVVLASSMAVYGEPQRLPVKETDPCSPTSPYGLSKLRGEFYAVSLALERGLKFVALRYFNTYGLRQKPSPYVGVITTFIRQALEGKPLTVFGDGNQTRDFVWVKDIARANVLSAMSEATGIFNVGTGIELSINQIADMVIEVLGGSKGHQEKPPGEVTRIIADISKAKRAFGYYPEGRLERILPSIIDYHRESVRLPRTSSH
jgi:UDP-glucose 4-epimerase